MGPRYLHGPSRAIPRTMTASGSPSRPPRPLKRPWYLMAALIASWIYGAQMMGWGYEVLAFFRGERPDIHELTDPIVNAEALEAAFAAGEQWLAVKDSAKKREMPFGAASMLLGGAMVLLAARSMAGREGSRRALVQVIVAHAGVMIAAFLYTRDVTFAEAAFEMRLRESPNLAMQSGLSDAAAREGVEAVRPIVERSVGPLVLLIRSVFSTLIVLALTRPRARAFFREAAPGPLGEG